MLNGLKTDPAGERSLAAIIHVARSRLTAFENMMTTVDRMVG